MNTNLLTALCLMVAGLLMEGCREQKVDRVKRVAPAPPTAVSVPPPPQQQRPGPSVAPAAASVGQQIVEDQSDAALRQILTKYFNEQAQTAQGWEELLAKKYITQIPTGSDGKPLDWNSTMQRMSKATVRPRQ